MPKHLTDGSLPSRQTANKFIPSSDIIALVNKDLTDDEIATLLGCDRSNITKRRQTLGLTRTSLKTFKESRADILAIQQARIMDSITQADIQKAGLRDKCVG
jgi:hypothetical protein